MSNENRVSEVRTSQSEAGREQRIFSFKASQLIWLLFGTLEALLVLRIALKLIGANPASPIVVLIYGLTGLFLIPFVGLISPLTSGNMILEISSLFAIGVYALIAIVFERLVWLIFYRPRGPVASVTETTSSEHHGTP
ncbi:MAG: YggT family protein [Chloroflexota bacterium]